MAMPSLLPVRLRRSRRCQRCGLLYPRKAEACTHCGELDDAAVAALRERVAEEHAGAAELGRLMAVAAIVVAGLVVALVLL